MISSRKSAERPDRMLRSAIVGTGFIADFHARGIQFEANAKLVAVCDTNLERASSFASNYNATAYSSLEELLATEDIDVLHVLTPPDLHHRLARQALDRGVNVFVEKPMCATAAETADLVQAARDNEVALGVNHSALFTPAYVTLRQHVRNGDLGPIDYVNITHLSELGVLRAGPFSNWIAKAPGHPLLEIGSHLISELIDLVGKPDCMSAKADLPLDLAGAGRAYRRWRLQADAGRTAVDVCMDFSPGFPQRTILLRGLSGTAICDLNANTCLIDRRTASSLDFDRRSRTLQLAKQLQQQAGDTLKNVLLSKAKLRQSGNPDQISIKDSIGCFYAGVRDRGHADARVSGLFGHEVVQTCEQIIDQAGVSVATTPVPAPSTSTLKPNVLVIGGTGFIGKALIGKLVEAGYTVRAAARGANAALQQLGGDRLEMVRADMTSAADLKRMLQGIDYVFHLATTDSKTWPEFERREVEPARLLAQACLESGIKRLVYTGTIDSLDAGHAADRITDNTALDRRIARRNNYARAKAAAEDVLLEAHRSSALPVVVARPAIVIGQGGNPFHWGVGRWASESVVELWGDGENKLPLVLVDDVATGLVRAMETPGLEGRSYNLVDDPLLSARDYIAALEKQCGFRIDARSRPVWKYYLEDLAKWPIKVLVRHPDAQRIPSYGDWASRTQRAVFDNSKAKNDLGWTPVSNASQLIDRGIAGSLKEWLRARS